MFASFENVPAAGAPGPRPRPRARVRRRRTPVVAWVVRIAVAGVAGLVPAWAPATEAGAAAADAIAFDVDMMKARGIDPRVADYFMRQARFMPGMSLVTLTVNGQRKGGAMVRFDEKGQLCMDARFLARAGLRVPPAPGAGRAGALARQTEKRAQTSGALGEIGRPPTGETSTATPAGDAMQPAGCIDYRAVYPQTIVTLKPNSAMVDLLVPTDALVPDAPAQPEYATGGVAGLLNYDLLAVGNSFAGGSSRYYSASGEFGFNAGDWIVRSRSMYSSDGAASNVSHLYLYGQRTFVPQEAVFQGGEINVGNSIFAGPAIYGVQWMPELALKRAVSPGTAVEGIAQTQARIEVRQAGALIFSTVVPPGPFALANIPLLNGSNDLDVTVIEANGAARRFLIPAAQLGAGTLGVTPGYAIAAGKLRQLGDDPRVKPWLVTATGTWEAGRRAAVTGGVLIGTQYQSVAGGLDARLGGTTSASMRAILSNAARESLRGAQFMGSVSTQLLPALAANFTMTQQTPGYRSITDTTEDTTVDWIGGHYRGQYTAGVAWGHPVLGAFSANYNWSSLFTGVGSRRLTASWGRTFRLATVSLNVEKGVGGRASGNGNSVLPERVGPARQAQPAHLCQSRGRQHAPGCHVFRTGQRPAQLQPQCRFPPRGRRRGRLGQCLADAVLHTPQSWCGAVWGQQHLVQRRAEWRCTRARARRHVLAVRDRRYVRRGCARQRTGRCQAGHAARTGMDRCLGARRHFQRASLCAEPRGGGNPDLAAQCRYRQCAYADPSGTRLGQLSELRCDASAPPVAACTRRCRRAIATQRDGYRPGRQLPDHGAQ